MSLARAYGEARKEGAGDELLDELVAAPPQVDPKEFGFDALREQAPERLRAAIALVEEKAARRRPRPTVSSS